MGANSLFRKFSDRRFVMLLFCPKRLSLVAHIIWYRKLHAPSIEWACSNGWYAIRVGRFEVGVTL